MSTALIALALAVTPLPAPAQDLTTCPAGISRDYLAAKQQYQTELRNLIAGESPELSSLADLNMELQIALAEARHIQLLYLLKTDPGRIVTGKGLSRFANFDWTPRDTADLAATDPAFSALETRIAHLEAQSNGHEQWPALRALVHDDLSSEPEFKKTTSALLAATGDFASRLEACPSP